MWYGKKTATPEEIELIESLSQRCDDGPNVWAMPLTQEADGPFLKYDDDGFALHSDASDQSPLPVPWSQWWRLAQIIYATKRVVDWKRGKALAAARGAAQREKAAQKRRAQLRVVAADEAIAGEQDAQPCTCANCAPTPQKLARQERAAERRRVADEKHEARRAKSAAQRQGKK